MCCSNGDGDSEFPTICGTGTEDYFGGAWNWEQPQGSYRTYSTPYLGMHQVIKPVTIQDLGWRTVGRYLPQQSDIASTAFWYQAEPHAPFAVLPGNDEREVI